MMKQIVGKHKADEEDGAYADITGLVSADENTSKRQQ